MFRYRCGRVARLLAVFVSILMLGSLIPTRFASAAAKTESGTAATAGLVKMVPGDWYTMAVDPDGTLWYWGSLNFTTATGMRITETLPVHYASPIKAVDVARSRWFRSPTMPVSVAVTAEGTVWKYDESAPWAGWTPVNGLSDVTAVAGGIEHFAALKSDGTVWTWGSGTDGVLGRDVTTSPADTPGQVTGLSGVVSIGATDFNTYAVKADGTVWGWGLNSAGQLGDGTTTDRATPVQAKGLTGVVELSTGYSTHALARTRDGRVWAWGRDGSGELGLGALSAPVLTPRLVPNLTDVISVTTTSYRSFAVTSDGTVWQWGHPYGEGNPNLTPVPVTGIPSMVSVVAGGTATYAQTATGEMWSWGRNQAGELGQGIPVVTNSPVYPPGQVVPLWADTQAPSWPVGASLRVEQVRDTSAVLVWDAAQDDLRVARYSGSCSRRDGGTQYIYIADPKVNRGTLLQLAPNHSYDCKVYAIDLTGKGSDPLTVTVTTTGDVYPPVWSGGGSLGAMKITDSFLTLAWSGATDDAGVTGYRVYQNGVQIGSFSNWVNTMAVTGLEPGNEYTFKVEAGDSLGNWSQDGPSLVARTDVRISKAQLSAAFEHATVLGPDGSVVWWGRGAPVAGINWSEGPQPLPGLAGLTAVATNERGVAVQRPDGSVWWLERNAVPVHQSGADGATALAGGWGDYILALMPDGTVKGWGSNAAGQLGDGTQEDRAEPVQVQGLTNVTAVAAGAFTGVALKADGTVWQWGYRMGTDGNTVPRALAPVQVSGLARIKAIAVFDTFGLALDQTGKVWAWGNNQEGELGDGTTRDRTAAVTVTNLSNVTAIAAGMCHSLAIKADGTVWTWGTTPATSATPRQVPGLTGATDAAAGYMYSLVLDRNGSLWSWGNNGTYSLGRGSSVADPLTPGKVALPWADVQAPVWPDQAALDGSRLSATHVTLTWPAARDDRAVTGYRILKNGSLVTTVAGSQTSFTVTGLKEKTSYSFQVQAGDAAGNWTTSGPTLTLTTPPIDRTAPALLRNDAGPLLLLMTKRGNNSWVTVPPALGKNGTIAFTTDTADLYFLVGAVTEPLDSLLVNGKSAPFEWDEGVFATQISPAGSATDSFKLEATDISGNKGTLATANVTYKYGPAVTVSAPAAGSNFVRTNTVTITGAAAGAFVGLAAVNADQPDQKFDLEYRVDGTKFTGTLTLPETPGTYRVRLVAFDQGANSSLPERTGKDLRTFIFDPISPAPVQLVSPAFADGVAYTNQSALTLVGKTEPQATVTATVGNKTYTATANAAGDFSIRNVAVPAAENQVRVTAADQAGNVSDATLAKLIVDKVAPTLQSAALRKAGGDAPPATIRGTQVTAALKSAGAYTLDLTFAEPLAGARVTDRKSAIVAQDGAVISVTVADLKEGANSFTVEARDRAGNTARVSVSMTLDTRAPQVSLTGSVRSWLLGAPATGDLQTLTIAGSSNEPLSTLRLVAVGDSDISALTLTTTISARDPKNWSATVNIPATTQAQWQFAFLGVDAAGNVSATPTAAVTVKIDPTRPTLSLTGAPTEVLYTGPNNAAAGVANGKLTVKGTAADGESGLKQVWVGTTKLAAPKPDQSFPFQSLLALSEGKLTAVPVYSEDMAGNRSEAVLLQAVLKTRVSLSKVTATWSGTAKSLTVGGSTDAAIKVDGDWVVVVPVDIEVNQGTNQVFHTTLDAATTEYNPTTGAFRLVIPGQTWAKGSYSVTVKALAPAEFSGIEPVVKTVTFTIR